MVSLFRRAIGFAFLYFILENLCFFALEYLGLSYSQDSSWIYLTAIAYLIPIALIALFTYFYVFAVKAHLSNGFRLRAALYLVLLAFGYLLVLGSFMNLHMVPQLLASPAFWIQSLLSFIIKYSGITIGNWLASHKIKTQGHI